MLLDEHIAFYYPIDSMGIEIPVWVKVVGKAIGAVSTVWTCVTFVSPEIEDMALEARRRAIEGTSVVLQQLRDANHKGRGTNRIAIPLVSFEPQFQSDTISYDLPEQFALASTKTAYSSSATAIYGYGDVIPRT